VAKKQKKIPLFQRNMDSKPIRNRVLIATPTLGNVRMEWATARWSQVVPCNWSCGFQNVLATQTFPIGYRVAEAQNIAVQNAVMNNFEWLFLHEDDVILPPDCYSKLNVYMKSGDVPIISGLYYLKANPTEPIAYRGRGNGCFDKFKIGEKVWVDGVPTGCLMIHSSILKLMYQEAEVYNAVQGTQVKRVFHTPSEIYQDPETGLYRSLSGTSDLWWCDQIMKNDVLKRAGWGKLSKQKYPFLLDTSIFCRHIDFSSGVQYPIGV